MTEQMQLELENPYEDRYVNHDIYRNILGDIKHKKNRVKFILEHFPETRNNDNYLCVMFWRLVDRCEGLDDVIRATKPEVIRRARQRINEEGEYLPTDPDIIKKRRLNAIAMREGIKNV